ncbi:growth hormone secretagogue receptor type 1-like [Seriola dumerili]|uniref:growth hormone secretagogue receptor type 1-like n=1 Tax=Seriola dumerili TaxID=41447 RepID=UPI000BBEA9DF|nr:growth hormone secretagogue receptor type 1-like [Seriola dumerili]
MANNNSLVDSEFLRRKINYQVILVQIFVSLFLCINFLLITTFFMKDFFYTTMRYILFANTLLSDCLILIITNLMLILSYFRVTIQMQLCLILFTVSSLCNFVTPVTLTAMTLERYVAVCMPLRHGELCSTRRTVHCILIIYGLSSVPVTVTLSVLFASITLSFYKQYMVCTVEAFLLYTWHKHLRSGISQFYFLIMFITIVSSYIKIMKVAKAASGEDKKSTKKGLRTVVLHSFQLLLCLIQLWCPFIESAVFQINVVLFINIRYFNYITFYLAPRCLSPLIYGLRDEKFFLALRHFALSGLCKNKSFDKLKL